MITEISVVSVIETEAVSVLSTGDDTFQVLSECGEPGPPGDASGAFLVMNRLAELDTPQAKVDARENLELQHIDCGEFL